ncbi:DUF4181 domain-containing protein [Halalkalibacter okhensis]|uniref:DUF4181 domain-containing protein n=1 Tax=Halalkalibacter okhensis TaxID=333138 RepID=A0A0B0IDB7_9BACI|nr:hypothetical protein LQ50_16395 [Halalkalibacter okhensis]
MGLTLSLLYLFIIGLIVAYFAKILRRKLNIRKIKYEKKPKLQTLGESLLIFLFVFSVEFIETTSYLITWKTFVFLIAFIGFVAFMQWKHHPNRQEYVITIVVGFVFLFIFSFNLVFQFPNFIFR